MRILVVSDIAGITADILLVGPEDEELYDLEGDPGELTSFSAVAERAPVKAELRGELSRLLAGTRGTSQ